MYRRRNLRGFFGLLKVDLPTVPLFLAPKDDAAEFDENEVATTKYEDDPKYVCKLW